MEEVLKKTSNLPSPTPLPTVVPEPVPIYHVSGAGDTGNRALWVVCVLMGLSSLAFYAMAARVPVQKRLFHVLTAFITTIAFISYMSMACGDGVSLSTYKIEVPKHNLAHHIYQREIYWARYVDWTLTTPLLLLDLSFMAGLSGANIVVAVFADVVMCLTGLFAAFGDTDGQKWGYYTVGCIAYLVIVYQLGINGRTAVANKDNKTKVFYSLIAGYTLLLWTAYPIVWGVSDGARLANVDAEIIAYSVLDILAKPVFGFWLLTTHDAMSRSSISIDGFWANGIAAEGAIRVGDDA